MRNGKKWTALSGALLVTCILTGCDTPRVVSAMLGDERTLPDGDEIHFTKPHRPILNPIGNSQVPPDVADARAASATAYNDASYNAVSGGASSQSGRHIPQENVAMLSNPAPQMQVARADTAVPPAPSAQMASIQTAPANPSIDSALDNALAKQPDPIAATQANPAVPATEGQVPEGPAPQGQSPADLDKKLSAEAAPSTPAATMGAAPDMNPVKLTPPSTPNAGDVSMTTSPTPVMASVQTNAPVESQATVNDAAAVAQAASTADQSAAAPAAPAPARSYPTLSSVPDAPKRTPASQISSDIKSLNTDRANNETAGVALMNNQNSTVMTSPKTGELVSDPAKAMAAASPSGGSDLTAPPAADTQQASDTITKALELENAQAANTNAPMAPANPSIDSAPVAQAPVTQSPSVPADTMTVALATAATVPAAAAPAAGIPTSTMGEVHLQPPPVIAETTAAPAPADANKQLTDVVNQGAVEPTAPPAPVTYLPENPYAKRRLAPVSDAY